MVGEIEYRDWVTASCWTKIMYTRSLGQFLSFSFGFAALTLMVFAALNAMHIPSGQFVDWIIGALTCWWLLLIVTVPWNIYFDAKGVVYEAAASRKANIKIDEIQVDYARKLARRALILALALHLLSAAGLFCLSFFHISPTGYIGSIAALLLTVLRPAVRAYEYMQEQLRSIRHQISYPREDVVLLQSDVSELKSSVAALQTDLNQTEPTSFAARQQRELQELRQRIEKLTNAQQKLEYENSSQHEKISRESQNAIAKISADTQFLDHVREIVKLIKTA